MLETARARFPRGFPAALAGWLAAPPLQGREICFVKSTFFLRIRGEINPWFAKTGGTQKQNRRRNAHFADAIKFVQDKNQLSRTKNQSLLLVVKGLIGAQAQKISVI